MYDPQSPSPKAMTTSILRQQYKKTMEDVRFMEKKMEQASHLPPTNLTPIQKPRTQNK